MTNHLTLTATPSESLRALEIAVAQRPQWRLMRGGSDDLPRFVIEKRVRYDLLRSLPLYAVYQVIGGFQKNQNGETTLQYTVSGQPWIAMFHAGSLIGGLLIFTFLLSSFVFSPTMVNQWVGVLLIGVMLVATFVYGVFAYRSYKEHLRELSRFMEAYAQGRSIGA